MPALRPVPTADFEAFDRLGFPRFAIDPDQHPAQSRIAIGDIESDRHGGLEVVQHAAFLSPKHTIVRTGHANVGLVGRTLR